MTLLRHAPNFRDLGGLPAGRRRLRPGLLYRSGALDRLDDHDRAQLAALQLRLSCDLRAASERRRAPLPPLLHPAARQLESELVSDVRELTPQMLQLVRDGRDAEAARQLMLARYRELPRVAAPVLAALLATLLEDEESLPALILCTAGKDRTGFVVALLLTALEVDADAIRADYLHSNRCIDRVRLDAAIQASVQPTLGVQLSASALDAINDVSSDYLDVAMAWIAGEFGSVEAYLQQVAGLDAARRRRLQERLLTSA